MNFVEGIHLRTSFQCNKMNTFIDDLYAVDIFTVVERKTRVSYVLKNKRTGEMSDRRWDSFYRYAFVIKFRDGGLIHSIYEASSVFTR
jgi:hypothetical protein